MKHWKQFVAIGNGHFCELSLSLFTLSLNLVIGGRGGLVNWESNNNYITLQVLPAKKL